MRNKELAGLLRQPRYEVIPTKGVEEQILGSVPFEVTITVTASPAKGLEPTFGLAERLAARGYRVVPHVSAAVGERDRDRRIPDPQRDHGSLDRLGYPFRSVVQQRRQRRHVHRPAVALGDFRYLIGDPAAGHYGDAVNRGRRVVR